MDKQQRTALQKNHMMIVEDLLVTDDFLGQCFQDDLFDLHLLEIIRVINNVGFFFIVCNFKVQGLTWMQSKKWLIWYVDSSKSQYMYIKVIGIILNNLDLYNTDVQLVKALYGKFAKTKNIADIFFLLVFE